MPVCLCVSGCVHVTDWRLAGVLMRPVCQYIITSVWAPPSLPHSSTAHMRHSNQPSQSPQRHRRQTVHLYIGHREKLHTGTRTPAIVIDINTHQRSWEGGGHGTRQLRAWSQNRVWIRLHHVRVPSCLSPAGLGAENAALTSSKCVFYPLHTGSCSGW